MLAVQRPIIEDEVAMTVYFHILNILTINSLLEQRRAS